MTARSDRDCADGILSETSAIGDYSSRHWHGGLRGLRRSECHKAGEAKVAQADHNRPIAVAHVRVEADNAHII